MSATKFQLKQECLSFSQIIVFALFYPPSSGISSVLGLLTRWCASTLGTALLFLFLGQLGSDLVLIWLHGLDSSSINWVSVVGLWIGRIGVGGDPFYKVEFVSSDNMMKYFFSSCQYFTVTTVGYTSVKITPILQR